MGVWGRVYHIERQKTGFSGTDSRAGQAACWLAGCQYSLASRMQVELRSASVMTYTRVPWML